MTKVSVSMIPHIFNKRKKSVKLIICAVPVLYKNLCISSSVLQSHVVFSL